MATVTGFTAARMQEIEDNAVVDGNILGNNLILVKHNGEQIDAGNVRGPQGPQGIQGAGATTLDGLDDVATAGLAAGKVLAYNGALWVPTTLAIAKTIRQALTYSLPGDIKVPSGNNDVLSAVPIAAPAGQTVTLRGYRWLCGSGSFTFKIEAFDGTTVTSLVSGIVASSAGVSRGTGTFATPYVVPNDNSIWYPTITATSAGMNGHIALILDVTV